VRRVVVRVRRRLERLGVTAPTDTDGDGDPLAEESAALNGLSQAAARPSGLHRFCGLSAVLVVPVRAREVSGSGIDAGAVGVAGRWPPPIGGGQK